MAVSYATLEQYVTATGDELSSDERICQALEELSAELRAECGIRGDGALSGDAAILARKAVVEAARKALVRPTLDGFAGDLDGVRQASFTSNGFTQSVTLPSGGARFDARTIARLKRLLGRSARAGMVYPYGW